MSYLKFEDDASEAGSVRGSTAWEQPTAAAEAQSSTPTVIQMSTALATAQEQLQPYVQFVHPPVLVVPTPAFRDEDEDEDDTPPKPCCSLTALIVWLVLLVAFQIAGFVGFVVG